MKLVTHFTDESVVGLRCEGDITTAQLKAGVDHLEQAAGANIYAKRVLMDLGKCNYIDSSGIGWLVGCHRRFRVQQGRMVLHTIPPMVRQTLRMLRLDQVLALANDENDARRVALEEKEK